MKEERWIRREGKVGGGGAEYRKCYLYNVTVILCVICSLMLLNTAAGYYDKSHWSWLRYYQRSVSLLAKSCNSLFSIKPTRHFADVACIFYFQHIEVTHYAFDLPNALKGAWGRGRERERERGLEFESEREKARRRIRKERLWESVWLCGEGRRIKKGDVM